MEGLDYKLIIQKTETGRPDRIDTVSCLLVGGDVNSTKGEY